jgi:AcrR family transcriptional regulator
LETAADLFSAHGYEATSLRRIASQAGVDVATLKYHFRDKPTLFGEIYREGHGRFWEAFEPILIGLDKVSTTEDLRVLIDDLVVRMHDFADAHLYFLRIVVFRMLEEVDDVIRIEDELQAIALSRLTTKFQRLVDLGVMRAVDTRALVIFLVSSFTTWHVTGRVKEGWFGRPKLASPAGRARSESFFVDLFDQYIL